ncbi:MAG: putative transporter [Frankiales bacterium]|nr:putative transporter [Frankiales bacterium]
MRRRAHEVPLTDRLAALREAVELAEGRLEVPEVGRARALLAKAGAREALGDATVVALAGATGSGKSTLFNALVGAEVSTPGVRRPTTGVAHGAVWGEQPADRLLDWLEVPRRHLVDGGDAALDGLVLLDLPDHDSTKAEHRLEVDRLVQLVDVLVWVLDPQKYADAAVHNRYLAPYAEHAGVLLVVLNQVDRLEAPAPVLADLRGLLDSEGLAKTPLMAVAGRTGQGLPELRAELARRVSARKAASDRLTAVVRTAAGALRQHCGTSGEALSDADRRQLVGALAGAAGVPTVVGAVERSARREGRSHTGWPVVRWTAKLRPDPLKRLHLPSTPGSPAARTSLPPAGATQQVAVTNALRRVRDVAGDGLPQAWRDDLRRTVEAREERLADRLDRAVAGAGPTTGRSPRWQSLVGGLQWLLALTGLVGGLWLLALVALGYLQLDDVVPLPEVQGFPLPTLLLVGGLLCGALLAFLAAPFVRASARRRAGRAEKRLHEAVEQVARDELLAPLAQEAAAHGRFCDALTRAVS